MMDGFLLIALTPRVAVEQLFRFGGMSTSEGSALYVSCENSAKIRLGCTRDQMNAIDVAQVVEGAGAAALTVHGRTAADMFSGSADWDRISSIKPFLAAM